MVRRIVFLILLTKYIALDMLIHDKSAFFRYKTPGPFKLQYFAVPARLELASPAWQAGRITPTLWDHLSGNKKTKCVTITPYIGTYKPTQQDSNPHLSFYLKKNCRKNCCKFPYFSYVLFVTTPSLELGNLPSTYDGVCLGFSPRWWWFEQLEACQWRLSLFSLLLIFFLVSRHLFPRWYSHRFIRILTVTLSVTHINVLTITTCLGVPTTLYPHYCRHASTQDCGGGRTRTCDPKTNRLLR